jgi:hypothetical protein
MKQLGFDMLPQIFQIIADYISIISLLLVFDHKTLFFIFYQVWILLMRVLIIARHILNGIEALKFKSWFKLSLVK